MALMSAGAEAWAKGLETWGKMLGGVDRGAERRRAKDRRFAAPEWRENPIFDTIRQTYLAIRDQLLGTVDEIEGSTLRRARGCASRRAASSMR